MFYVPFIWICLNKRKDKTWLLSVWMSRRMFSSPMWTHLYLSLQVSTAFKTTVYLYTITIRIHLYMIKNDCTSLSLSPQVCKCPFSWPLTEILEALRYFLWILFPWCFRIKASAVFFHLLPPFFSISSAAHLLSQPERSSKNYSSNKKNVLMKTTKIRLCTSQTFSHRVFPSESSDFEEFSAMFFLLQVTSCFSVSSKDSSYFQSFFQF